MAHPAVLLVPFPAQGHITPMLQLAGVLAAHGVAPTVAVPDFIHRRIAAAASGCVGGGVALASIPSGIVIQQDAAAGGDDDDTPGFRDIVHSMEHHMPLHLERMLLASASPRSRAPPPVACVVVDVLASWAVPVAARCGVPAAGFWPAMLACYRVVAAIPELLDKGLISESGTRTSHSVYMRIYEITCIYLSAGTLTALCSELHRTCNMVELTLRWRKPEDIYLSSLLTSCICMLRDPSRVIWILLAERGMILNP